MKQKLPLIFSLLMVVLLIFSACTPTAQSEVHSEKNNQHDGLAANVKQDPYIGVPSGGGDFSFTFPGVQSAAILQSSRLSSEKTTSFPVYSFITYDGPVGLKKPVPEGFLESLEAKLLAFLSKANVTIPDSARKITLETNVTYIVDKNNYGAGPNGISALIDFGHTDWGTEEQLDFLKTSPLAQVAIQELKMENPVVLHAYSIDSLGDLQESSYKIFDKGDTLAETLYNEAFRYVEVARYSFNSPTLLFSYVHSTTDLVKEQAPLLSTAEVLANYQSRYKSSIDEKKLSEAVILYMRLEDSPFDTFYFVPHYVFEKDGETHAIPAVNFKIPGN